VLDKAASLLSGNLQSVVRFYSRSEFGALAKLSEYSTGYGNEADYRANLTKGHIKTDSDLAEHHAAHASALSTYEFLHRSTLEISPEFDHMETLLHERLRQMANNSNAAFNALWTRLDKLGGRM
jgi:hypothetical protein